MEEKQLNIDPAAVARETLLERQAGEDLDEALLRSCKKLYGDTGMIAFQAMQNAVATIAERSNSDREAALKQIAEGKSSIRVSTSIHTTHKFTTSSMGELSPEMRAEVDKALAEGKSKVVLTKTFSLGKKQPATNRCAGCGFEFPSEISTCPQCGKTLKSSFWSRLFGK
jgi:lipopolysaccharide biosynthesis regulator YciM